MCGITGYIGFKDAYPIVINGLKRLEYRGYDSAGIMMYDGENIHLSKTKGIFVGLKTASLVKEELSTFDDEGIIAENKVLQISGADATSGQPLTVEVVAADIKPVLVKAMEQFSRLIELSFLFTLLKLIFKFSLFK